MQNQRSNATVREPVSKHKRSNSNVQTQNAQMQNIQVVRPFISRSMEPVGLHLRLMPAMVAVVLLIQIVETARAAARAATLPAVETW
jgi:hypothetical protein